MKTRLIRQRVSASSLLLALLMAASVRGDEWIEVKDVRGRPLTVKIENVEGDDVTFSTRDGKTYTYSITKFSLIDQLNLRKWKPSTKGSNPVKEDSKLEEVEKTGTQSVFRTKHFEFQVMGDVEADQLASIAPLFEAVHWAFLNLPVQVEPKPADSFFKVRIYLSEKELEIASKEILGSDQPAVFNLSLNLLLAPIERLKPSPALVREIAFTLLGEQLATLPPWLASAIAEYVAAAPYKDNELSLEDPLANMKRHLAEAYGLSDKAMPMMEPSAVMALNYGSLRAEGLEGNKSRSSALLLFHYFAHLDREGLGLTNYLRAVRASTPAEESAAALTGEREPVKLQDDIKVAYVPKGLRITFIE